MKFKDKYDIAPGYEDIFSFKSKEDEIEHEAAMIMFRFLSELERISEANPLKKKDIADAIGTSASFVTQLYQGDKLLNLLTIAKLQDVFNITFEITAKDNSESYKEEVSKNYDKLPEKNKTDEKRLKELYKNIPTLIKDSFWIEQHKPYLKPKEVKGEEKMIIC